MTLDQVLLIVLIMVTGLVGIAYVYIQRRTRYTLESARLEHYRDLAKLISEWETSIDVPKPETAVALDAAKDTRRYYWRLATETDEVRHDIENDTLFSSLERHIPKTTMRNWGELKKAMTHYVAKCHDLYQLIQQECEGATGLSTGHYTWRIVMLPLFIEQVYKSAFDEGKWFSPQWYDTSRQQDGTVWLQLSGQGIAKSEPTQIEQVRSVHEELVRSSHGRHQEMVEDILRLEEKSRELQERFAKELAKLASRKLFSGRCDLCP